MEIFDSACWLIGFFSLFCGVLYVAFGLIGMLAELIAWSVNRAVKQPANIRIWFEFVKYKREKLADKTK